MALSEANLALAVRHLIKRPPLFVDPGSTVAQAAQAMQSARVGSALVATEPPGIVTDRDLRGRVLAVNLPPSTPVSQIMTQPVKTIDAGMPSLAALRLMLEENIHHLPVTDEGRILGVISASDLLLHQEKSPVYLRAAIENIAASDQLATYATDITELVAALHESGLDAIHTSQIVSSLNDALVRRLIAVASEQLGPAPAPFAWIVFGSEGRLEQALLTDQDNALIYAQQSDVNVEYFRSLATKVIEGLIQAGFPPCAGGFMATRWCKPLEEWRELFNEWIRVPKPDALLDASIFFDFRAVAGTLSLASLDEIIGSAKSAKRFLAHLARDSMRFQPPLTLLNRLRTDNGKIDLKAGGIAPIVGLARAAALAAGSAERGTLDRLAAAARAGEPLTEETAHLLAEIFPFLLHLRLRRQLAAHRQAQQLDHKIELTELSSLERRRLKDSFVVIKQIQEDVRLAWRLDEMG